MKKSMSLRLRITLLCAVLLALCCVLLTLSNNLSAIQMVDTIQAASVLPAQGPNAGGDDGVPMMELVASETALQARGEFHIQSLLAMAAILLLGLLLIYHLVGKALAPLDSLTRQIRERTAGTSPSPSPSRTAGTKWPSWLWPSGRCPSGSARSL